ncbi:MAG: hypothetical protein ACYC5N_06005, partial [Endomicrobiales bacterium]
IKKEKCFSAGIQAGKHFSFLIDWIGPPGLAVVLSPCTYSSEVCRIQQNNQNIPFITDVLMRQNGCINKLSFPGQCDIPLCRAIIYKLLWTCQAPYFF